MISLRTDALVELRTGAGPAAENLQQLDRVLRSDLFRSHSKAYKELKLLVEESLMDKHPKQGSYCSAQALSELLRLYAKSDGAHDPIRILLQPDTSLPAFLRNEPRLFVSHRHKDVRIAGALMSALESAFELSRCDARCTTARPYRLSVGERTNARLRDDLSASEVVLGIVAPDVTQSAYVPFELGAAWSRHRPTWPLLVRGASVADLPGPIRELNALSLSDPADCQELLDEIDSCTTLRRRVGVAGDVSDKIRQLAELAAQQL